MSALGSAIWFCFGVQCSEEKKLMIILTPSEVGACVDGWIIRGFCGVAYQRLTVAYDMLGIEQNEI